MVEVISGLFLRERGPVWKVFIEGEVNDCIEPPMLEERIVSWLLGRKCFRKKAWDSPETPPPIIATLILSRLYYIQVMDTDMVMLI
jgi:hypothetical protein